MLRKSLRKKEWRRKLSSMKRKRRRKGRKEIVSEKENDEGR